MAQKIYTAFRPVKTLDTSHALGEVAVNSEDINQVLDVIYNVSKRNFEESGTVDSKLPNYAFLLRESVPELTRAPVKVSEAARAATENAETGPMT